MRIARLQPLPAFFAPVDRPHRSAAQVTRMAQRRARPTQAGGSMAGFAASLARGSGAQLRDGELAEGVSLLHDHVVRSGFFGNRFDDMQRIVDPKTGLEVQLSPNRKAVGVDKKNGAEGRCVLCTPSDPQERRAYWRSYAVLPNKYPYVPAESRHMLILSRAHRTQSYSPTLLNDMIDYQRFASAKRPVTMHYNGVAGNSQTHLHWQATHESLPLQRGLEDGSVATKRLRQSTEGTVETFEQGLYAGFVLTGSKAHVTRWASEIVERLDKDPRTSIVDKNGKRKGAYNMLLLPTRDGRARLVILPRRADHLKVEVGSAGPVGVGAFSLGGVFVMVRDQVPADFFDKVEACVRATVVPPSEFDWTSSLARMPESSILRARAA